MRRALVVLALPLVACSDDAGVCGDGFSAPGQICFEERVTDSETLLALGDANNDSNTDALTLVSLDPPRVGVQLGQDDGTFAEPRASMVLDHLPYGAAIGSVDHDFG